MPYEHISIELPHLRLNKENDRHGPLPSEVDCIQWMLDNLGKEIQNLASDIANRGLSPIDGILVVNDPESKEDYIVWEGNRRITALKLLDDPNRCPDPRRRKKFAEIRKKAKVPIPHKLECVLADSVEDAEWPMELRHQGPQGGVGTLHWDGLQKTRHLQRLGRKGRYAFTHQVIDSIADKLEPNLRNRINTKGFAISTLDRLLKNPDVRNFLGITSEDGVPRRFLRESETVRGLTRIFTDIADGNLPVRNVYTADQQREYLSRFPPEFTPDKDKTIKDSRPMIPSASSAANKTTLSRVRQPSDKRKHLVPSGVQYSISDTRLRAIFRELRELDLSKHRNATSVLFRVFIELSIDLFLDDNGINYHVNDKLSKKAEKAATHMKHKNWANKRQLKGILAAVASSHNVLSFDTFNAYVHNRLFHPQANELATAWDNVQTFLDVLYVHLK